MTPTQALITGLVGVAFALSGVAYGLWTVYRKSASREAELREREAKSREEAARIRTLHQQQVEREQRQRERDERDRLAEAERRAAEVRDIYRAGDIAKRIESPEAEVSDAAAKEASADALRALSDWDDARR